MYLSRREFIAAASVAATTPVLNRTITFAQDTADLRVAVVGVRGQGFSHIQSLEHNVVALCDVDEQVLHERAQWIQSEWNRKVETFTDFRQLLDRDDIDAISIATPNHTHALITIAAAQAGKDVYVEKPISHNIWEGRQMVAVARKHNRIIQCGTQSRSSPSLKAAVEFVRTGSLGKIRYALGTCYKPRLSIGKLEIPLTIPAHIDYDLWCGPAEKRDLYRPELHYDWHWDFNTGNGDMGNQGIHQMDIARWFLGEATLPPRTLSIGGRLGYEDAGNTPNTQIVYHDYPAAPLIFETRGLPRSKQAQRDWGNSMDKYRGSDIGVIVQCENGYVLVPNYYEAFAFDKQGAIVKRWSHDGNTHHENWRAAIVARDAGMLNAEILEGHISSSLCHVGNISHQLGTKQPARAIAEVVSANDLLANSFDRMAAHLRANDIDIDGKENLTLGPWLEIDPVTENFASNDQANELRARKQRAPFIVPEIA